MVHLSLSSIDAAAPNESATSYKEFTIKKGNDNNVWINIKDKNKI
jgi:hypothetical protein